jgi:intergrase/recombinase
MAGGVGFEPTTTNLGEFNSIDWTNYKVFLDRRYNKQYAVANYNYARKYWDFYFNPSKILSLQTSMRANVVKALIALSKFQGNYLEFKERIRQHGIKWVKPDNFTAFLNILNNKHDDLKEWYKAVQDVLGTNYRVFLRFVLLSGLRKGEALKSFNKIIELAQSNKLGEYYNNELSILEHFRYPNEFLRGTKNVYISILPNTIIEQIANSEPVTYASIHKFLERRHFKLRLKELRSYYASYLRKHGMISELVDLIQGRIGKDVFIRHYLKENPNNLSSQVLALLKDLEDSLLLERTIN